MKNPLEVCLSVIILIVFGWISFGFAQEESSEETNLSFSTGISYDSLQDDLSPKTSGHEFTIPLTLEYKRKSLSVTIETSYSNADMDFGEEGKASLSGLTDTTLDAAYEFTTLPVNLTLGVTLNLPTGQAILDEEESRMENFLRDNGFKVYEFGEGLDIGLSLGVRKDFNETLSGEFQTTYTNCGKQDDFEPGDTIELFTNLEWKSLSWLKISPNFTYTYTAPDKTNGKKDFQIGEKFEFGCDIAVSLAQTEILISLIGKMQGKNKEFGNAAEALELNTENSTSNTFKSSLEIFYEFEKFTLQGLGEWWYYSESDDKDSESGLPTYGKLTRFAFGPGFEYNVNQQISLNGSAKYVRINEDKNIDIPEDRTYQGINMDFGVTYAF